ncbi:alpha/beta fold hydrolase [Pseudoduganella violaceinigra]|uniref:alpha/beta fold hydrolase n=1 Tax=Pseudoduganella violaceinigra TaxID=246602 RepID=UPI0006858123|nr:alpha/beta hydrolase [Pseudoduganella violaceinigra]
MKIRHLLQLLPLTLALPQLPAYAQAFPPAASCSAGTPVDEKGFVRIGGMDQWVRIKGSNCANPIVVLVHGGPGNPTTPFADKFYQSWEKDLTIVQWDQRGAGMTFGRTPLTDDIPLKIEELRDDGIEVARFAAKRFGKERVILLGGSWSSVLGVHMAKAAPGLFCGYISSSQLVGEFSDRRNIDATLALARAAGDQESISKIEALGPLPWTNPRNPGILRRVMRKYEAMSTEPVPKAWMGATAEYATAKYDADYAAGEDYSWLQFVGMKGDGIGSKIDLYKLGPKFDVPFYMVQGEQDLVTMPEPSRRYFDFIQAPYKEFVTVPRAGHDPNPPMVATQLRLLKKIGDCH